MRKLYLVGEAFCDGTTKDNYFYMAYAKDEHGDSYTIFWDIIEDLRDAWWDDEIDEENACVWDCPSEVINERGCDILKYESVAIMNPDDPEEVLYECQ